VSTISGASRSGVNGSLFTATNTNTNASDPNSLPATFTFQVARSGNLSILLAAGTKHPGFVLCTTSTTLSQRLAADSTQEMLIGLPESDGLADEGVQAKRRVPQRAERDAADHGSRGNSQLLEPGAVVHRHAGLFRVDVIDAVAPTAMLEGAPTVPLFDRGSDLADAGVSAGGRDRCDGEPGAIERRRSGQRQRLAPDRHPVMERLYQIFVRRESR